MKPKSSRMWNNVIEVFSDSAKCKLCMKTYSRKGGTTTSLKVHLKYMGHSFTNRTDLRAKKMGHFKIP